MQMEHTWLTFHVEEAEHSDGPQIVDFYGSRFYHSFDRHFWEPAIFYALYKEMQI